MALRAGVVELSTVNLTPMARRMRAERIARYGEEKARRGFQDYDWQRLSYVGRRLKGAPSILEVGPGRGFLSRMIAKGGKYPRQVAVDVVDPPKSPKHKYGPGVEFRQQSVVDLPDPDGAFDTVLCMEVLEHLDDDALPRAIAQIRRVCARRLIISVPYLEPLPLPAYHRQRFDEARVKTLFPDAKYTLLLKTPVNRLPWLMIEETRA